MVGACCAKQPDFTFEDIAKGRFKARNVSGVRPMADGEYYTAVAPDATISKFNYKSGDRERVLFDPGRQDWHGVHTLSDYSLSPDEKLMLLRADSKPLYRRSCYSSYFVTDLNDGSLHSVSESDSLRYACFSPDSKYIAFVLDNNIFIKNICGGEDTKPVAVTHDGALNFVINGVPDWVYEEEWNLDYALRWSPDSRKLAFLRFDESRVKDYSIDIYGQCDSSNIYPKTFTYKYPVAGEDNAVVSLHVFDLDHGTVSSIDLGNDPQQYVPFFGWTPNGLLYFYKINRLQNDLQVFADDLAGNQQLIYHETSDKYIDNIDDHTVTFLADGDRFVVRNETAAGYMHLYLYSIKKGLLNPITSGDWNVTEIVGIADGRVWYLSNETSPLRNNLYSIRLDGSGKRRLTSQDGIYAIAPSAGCKYYISYFSNSSTPNTVTLCDGKGKFIRLLEDNTDLKDYIASINFPVKEFFEFTVDNDGQPLPLNCYIVKPSDFDPDAKYPVLFTQYSGPGSQRVLDQWLVDWEDALVQMGYIVVCMDPRGTGGRSEDFKKLTYGHMGELETADFIALAQHVAQLPYVDPERIGIYGGSYGGFMALNCILHGNDVFSLAIAVAPVTSWRYYDSVYTERVNSLPQINPEGYDRPSPIFYADKLKGKLLIIHGTGDDNVHPQNSYKMIYELVRANKYFDTMFYTDDNHSLLPNGRMHVRQKMYDYCLQNL